MGLRLSHGPNCQRRALDAVGEDVRQGTGKLTLLYMVVNLFIDL